MQRKMIFQDDSPSPSNPDQLLSWFPQGLGNQRQELSCPSTSIPRYNLSQFKYTNSYFIYSHRLLIQYKVKNKK